jgi:hypothetical protein
MFQSSPAMSQTPIVQAPESEVRLARSIRDNLAQVTPQSVAHIVQHRAEPKFLDLVREADAKFEHADFESALADVVRDEPGLTDLWATWSADQRWTPSAYINGKETGRYDSGQQQVRVHPDTASAVADFIHRMAACSARREVITVDA